MNTNYTWIDIKHTYIQNDLNSCTCQDTMALHTKVAYLWMACMQMMKSDIEMWNYKSYRSLVRPHKSVSMDICPWTKVDVHGLQFFCDPLEYWVIICTAGYRTIFTIIANKNVTNKQNNNNNNLKSNWKL